MPTTITVPSSVFTMADAYCARDDYRPALACVVINTQSKQAYAANGFTMSAVPATIIDSDATTPKTILIHRSALAQAKKIHTDKHEAVHIAENGKGEWHIICRVKKAGMIAVPFVPLMGHTAIDFEQIFPKHDEARHFTAINPDFLKAMAQLTTAHNLDALRIEISDDPRHPILATGADGLRIVTMPLMTNTR